MQWPDAIVVTCRDLTDLISKLSHPRMRRWNWVWRGVGNVAYRLDSGIVRKIAQERFSGDARLVTEEMVREAERKPLWDARQAGYANRVGLPPLSEDELRARLQHQGAATRLLDVSTNAFVALFMALDSENETVDAALFAFDWTMNRDRVTPGSVAEMVKHPHTTWKVSYDIDIDARLRAQHGQFILGRIPDSIAERSFTSLPLQFPQHKIARIFSESPGPGKYPTSPTIIFRISAGARSDIKKFLECVLDMCKQTIYPDLAGFARANAVTAP